MHNKAMERKLSKGEAINVSNFKRATGPYEGCYVLPPELDIEDKDLCDADTETWIWSVGECLCCGVRLASPTTVFYKNDKFKCLWLR